MNAMILIHLQLIHLHEIHLLNLSDEKLITIFFQFHLRNVYNICV